MFELFLCSWGLRGKLTYYFLLKDHKPRDRKGCKDATGKLVKECGNDNIDNLAATESKTTSTSDAGKASFVVEDSQTTSVDFLEAEVYSFVSANFQNL